MGGSTRCAAGIKKLVLCTRVHALVTQAAMGGEAGMPCLPWSSERSASSERSLFKNSLQNWKRRIQRCRGKPNAASVPGMESDCLWSPIFHHKAVTKFNIIPFSAPSKATLWQHCNSNLTSSKRMPKTKSCLPPLNSKAPLKEKEPKRVGGYSLQLWYEEASDFQKRINRD